MYLQKLELENFRNYPKLDIKFEAKPGIFILLGENAQGKTNFLESIFLLSFPRSFRAKTQRELIKFSENYYTIKGQYKAEKSLSLKIGYQQKPVKRSYQKNDVQIQLKEYLTNFQSVIFTPEDIEIISGAPSDRRRLIDTILSQTDREYFEDLVGFTRILKQRNALLKKIKGHFAKIDELKYWDDELIRLTIAVTEKRKKFFKYVAENLPRLYQDLADDHSEQIHVDYNYTAKTKEDHFDDYPTTVRAYLEDERKREIEIGHTIVGPHRDDFSLKLNDRPVANYCSRGEKRTFMLALKIVEMQYLEEVTGQRPVLLLDDVFSELDPQRRMKLIELAKEYQTFISTVEESYFADYKGKIRLFKVEKNEVLPYN